MAHHAALGIKETEDSEKQSGATPGAIPLAYTVLSLLSIVMFTVTRRYDLFRFIQLSLMLVLPFALMVALGGFVPSSVVATTGTVSDCTVLPR